MDASEPFAQSGAVPAGFAGPDDKHLGETMGKGYGRGGDLFDDDEGPSAYSFSAPQAGPYARAKRGRWATFKENHLTDVDWTFGVNSLLGRKSKFDGVPREISLNDPAGNKVKGFENNSVSTGKYGPITFLPKFLFCKLLQLSPVASSSLFSRILEVRQSILPVHGVHSTSTRSIADWPVHYHRSPSSGHHR
jgi:phospholipid-transporting ATPase